MYPKNQAISIPQTLHALGLTLSSAKIISSDGTVSNAGMTLAAVAGTADPVYLFEFTQSDMNRSTFTLEATYSDGVTKYYRVEIDESIASEVTEIKAKTDNLPASPMPAGDVTVSAASISAIASAVWGATSRTLSGFGSLITDTVTAVWAAASRTLTATDKTGLALEASVLAVKAKTDTLPASPAAEGSAMTLADGAITAAKIGSDAITAAKLAADAISEIQDGLATEETVAAIPGIGTGNIEWEHTVTDENGDPVQGAIVEYYTTSARTGKPVADITNTFGKITVKLSAGHYYLKVIKDGKITLDDESVA